MTFLYLQYIRTLIFYFSKSEDYHDVLPLPSQLAWVSHNPLISCWTLLFLSGRDVSAESPSGGDRNG